MNVAMQQRLERAMREVVELKQALAILASTVAALEGRIAALEGRNRGNRQRQAPSGD